MISDLVDSLSAGSTLTRLSDGAALPRHDVLNADPLIILIHGFTASGPRLGRLGARMVRWSREDQGLKQPIIATYDYNSYKGIEAAAITLHEKLFATCAATAGHEGNALNGKIVFVAHSMGGLVARQFTAYHPSLVRGVVMFGVPNDGVFTDGLLDCMITFAENLNEIPLPHMRKRSSLARRELTKKDQHPGGPLIDRLARSWSSLSKRPPTLTISGGRRRIDISGNRLLDSVINLKIQRLMQGQNNDGLVSELSVDMNGVVFHERAPEYTHFNRYTEYSDLNHSYLVDNENLARITYNWLTGHA